MDHKILIVEDQALVALDQSQILSEHGYNSLTCHFSEAVLRAIPDLVFRLDQSGVFLSYPSGATDRLYIPPDQFLGKRVRDVMPGTIGIALEETITAALTEGSVRYHESQLEELGQTRYFESRVVPFDGNSVVAIVRDVTEWREAVARVESLLEEQRVLMSETQHRVKKRHVYGALSTFTTGLVHDVQSAAALFPVDVHCTAVDMWVPSNVAVQIGIVVNELLINALKYAFQRTNEPQITVSLLRATDGEWLYIEVGDNGAGMSESANNGQGNGFGMVMISALVDQLGGTHTVRNEAGTCVKIQIPIMW